MAQQNVRFVRVRGRIVPIRDDGRGARGNTRSKKQLQADLRRSQMQGAKSDRGAKVSSGIVLSAGALGASPYLGTVLGRARVALANKGLRRAGRQAVEQAARGDLKAGMRAVSAVKSMRFNMSMAGALKARGKVYMPMAAAYAVMSTAVAAGILYRGKKARERRAQKQARIKSRIDAAQY